jgi:hypothetical protein
MILTRRNFLKGIVPAAAGGLVLAEELLHPGRTFFLPARVTYQGFENIIITGGPLYGAFAIEDIIKKALARDMVKVIDQAAWKSFNVSSEWFA